LDTPGGEKVTTVRRSEKMQRPGTLKAATMSFRRRLLPLAALLLLAAHLAAGAVHVLPTMVQQAYAAFRDADLDADETRALAFGDAWVLAIDSARATLPSDGTYLLVRGAGAPEGSEHWPRYELAPRRALFLGAAEKLPSTAHLRRMHGEDVWVVVACDPYEPPRLMPLWHLLTDLDAGRSPSCR
jgi:hypothetical protein